MQSKLGNTQPQPEPYGYLNFFELLSPLRASGQISQQEITALFDYDLRMLKKHSFIMSALAAQGFERLPGLLLEIRGAPPQ